MAKYLIPNLDAFTENVRTIVFSAFGKASEESPDEFTNIIDSLSSEDQQEMDDILSHKESKTIVKCLIKKETNKKTKETRYVLDENIFASIVEALNARLVSNILMSLNAKGYIESAYDSELDDFVFWSTDTPPSGENIS